MADLLTLACLPNLMSVKLPFKSFSTELLQQQAKTMGCWTQHCQGRVWLIECLLTIFIQIWHRDNLHCWLEGGTTFLPHSMFVPFIENGEAEQQNNTLALNRPHERHWSEVSFANLIFLLLLDLYSVVATRLLQPSTSLSSPYFLACRSCVFSTYGMKYW